MSTIAAGITSGTALVSTGDTAGTLIFQTNGTTTALTLGTNQSATFVGAVTAPSFSGTSSTATNLAGGSNGTIPYQSAAGTTQMLAVGTAGQLLQTNGVGAPSWATVSAGFTLATPVSVSGTSVSFTGIPAGANQIVLMFNAVKSNAAVNKFIQLGDSGGFITTGYVAQENYLANTAAADSFTDAWRVRGDVAATTQISGAMTFSRYNGSAFTYIGVGAFSYPQNDKATTLVSGIVTLTSVLTQIRVTVSATTFDTGSINIAYI